MDAVGGEGKGGRGRTRCGEEGAGARHCVTRALSPQLVASTAPCGPCTLHAALQDAHTHTHTHRAHDQASAACTAHYPTVALHSSKVSLYKGLVMLPTIRHRSHRRTSGRDKSSIRKFTSCSVLSKYSR